MKKKYATQIMDYSAYASVEYLHYHSRRWLSEIDFRKEEFDFMQKLIDQHFVYFIDPKRSGETIKLRQKIKSLEEQLADIENNVVEHEAHLKKLLEVPSDTQERKYRTEHQNLEDKMNAFIQESKLVKKALFKTADEVLKEEKMQRLINQQ